MLFSRVLKLVGGDTYNSAAAYQGHLKAKLRLFPKDRDLAFANAIGSETVRWFRKQGNGHVAVLRHHGLVDGMAIYDLGCGCGRTAQALRRAGWHGRYIGTDIVQEFVDELKRKCPGFDAYVHREPTIRAADQSLDMVFHWSVFTHISPEECFLYLQDGFRALKPGGKMVFSFLEMTDPSHFAIFENRLERLRGKRKVQLLDTFLHRDWIAAWALRIGFSAPEFTEGADDSDHPRMWQTVAAMTKP